MSSETKYPTIPEVEARVGMPEQAWDRVLPETLIKHICDLYIESQQGAGGESIPWAEYPWAMWAAKDEDDSVWLFEIEPIKNPRGKPHWVEYSHDGRTENDSDATIPGPWTQSLRKRPENV